MLVRTPYGATQNMPDRLAKELIRQGRVTAVKPAAPEPKPKAPKAKKAE